MIGSLMSRMGMAQKLSVAQLKQAVQDGSLPAYVGIPMIQDKMKQQQEAQAGKQAPAQPPIAEQVMAAAGQEERGIDAARSNLSMSGGGIASYADGNDVDSEDYEDYLQEAQDQEDLQLAEMMGSESGVDSVYAAKEPAFVNKTPNVEKGIEGATDKEGKLISHILHKESRGRRFDDKGNLLRSSEGALGEMQVMPATAMKPGFGIKPASDVNNPDELARVGRELSSALLNKYKDPQLAAAAYNWGSGNVDKWLAKGANPANMPKETRDYIVGANFAEGGIASIKRYAFGDVVNFGVNPGEEKSWDSLDPKDNFGVRDPSTWNDQDTNFGVKNPNWDESSSIGSNPKINSPGAVRGHENEIHPNTQNWGSNQPASNGIAGAVPPAGPAGPTGSAEPSAFDKWLENVNQEREGLKSQKEEDKYLSLMAAGLGILKASGDIQPGKVHSTLGDIGAGGIEGLGMYATLAKQRAAQEAALNKEMGVGLYRQELARTTGASKTAQQNLEQARLDETKRMNDLREREFNIGALDKLDQGLRSRWIQDNKNSLEDEETKKQKQDDYVYSNPSYRNAWKRAHPDLPLPEASRPVIVTTPEGKSFTFPNQESADKFKKDAGIK